MTETKLTDAEMTVSAIQTHLDKTTPGPWRWSGNTDYGDVGIVAKGRFGATSVLRMLNVDRTEGDSRIANLDECFDSAEEIEEAKHDFLFDDSGLHRTDPFIAFAVEDRLVPAKDIVIYEVCREATSATDRRVYRRDIVGIRHPDAEFMVASPTYVRELLDIVGRLQRQVADLTAEFGSL